MLSLTPYKQCQAIWIGSEALGEVDVPRFDVHRKLPGLRKDQINDLPCPARILPPEVLCVRGFAA